MYKKVITRGFLIDCFLNNYHPLMDILTFDDVLITYIINEYVLKQGLF